MDNEWMKLKNYLEVSIKEKNKKWCSYQDIIERRILKDLLNKMEELESGK